MTTLPLLVKQMRHEADGVVSVDLVSPTGAALPGWTPGAHVEIVAPNGTVRQYSLCGDPARVDHYLIGVLREENSRGGSKWIHEELRVGSTVEVGSPRNHFEFLGVERVRFIAGGIGITPLLPMVRDAQARGLDWQLTYGGRSRSSMAFLQELPCENVSVQPHDEVGHIDLGAAIGDYVPGTVVYVCGPTALLAAVREHCAEWPEGALRFELFAAPEMDALKQSDAGEMEGLAEFTVRAEHTGVEVVVSAGQSIIDRLEEAGVNTPFSCREGICGSCETPVIEGDPLHRDYVLTKEERNEGRTMMICVSRCASTRLVLDI